MALRTFTSAGVNNLWSNAANWDTAPIDADTFTLAAGQTCEFDADQSAWAGLGASTIPAGTTLIATTTAGAYVLKMNGDLTVNGTLRAGTSEAVPYPSTCTFTVNLSSGSNSIVMADATGNVQFFCVEPVVKYVKLSANEAAGQTVLSVDDDVTADTTTWAATKTLFIANSLSTLNRELITFASATASTITIDAPGLVGSYVTGAVIALVTRNIRVINSTDYAFKEGSTVASHVDCEINNVIGGFQNTQYASIGGSVLITTTSSGNGIGATLYYCTFDGVACNTSASGTHYGINGCNGCTFESDSLTSGFRNYSVSSGRSSAFYGLIQNAGWGFNACASISVPCDIVGVTYAFLNSYNFWFSGTTTNVLTRNFDTCSSFYVGNAEISNIIGGGAVATYDVYNCTSGKFFNTLWQGTTEFLNYNEVSIRAQWDYLESFDHDQQTNAYKAWVVGGIVSSQTASPPSGYTIWYELACESATYPCFRQYQTVVLPGTAIEVEGLIRIADAADHTTYPPRLQIIDVFADPLVDSTQSPLDESQVADPDGSDSSWQAVSVIWANQGDSPRTVIVRMIAKHATGDVDTVWAVADYQDQINETLQRVKRIGLTSEF